MSATLELTTAGEVNAQVERILQSKGFRSSGVLRHLLAYLTGKCLAGDGDSLKEYTIGIDALGKPETFDPRQESVVRMHTARLRQKLADYYRTEGLDDPIILDLPKGGFKVTFEVRPQLSAAAPTSFIEPNPRRWSRRESVLGAALLVVIVCLLSVCAAVAWAGFRVSDSAPGMTADLKEIWAPLISSNRRVVVCIATPLFVDVPGFGSLRDFSVNDWDNVTGSKGLASVERALDAGMSAPSWDYTEVGTATGAFLLAQFLAPLRANVLIKPANLLSWPQIADDNVVFLGPPAGIHQFAGIPMDSQIALEPTGVRNLHPRGGEPGFLADTPSSNDEESGLSHAVITRIPATNGHGAILILSGNQIASVIAGVQALTDPALAHMLVSRLKGSSGTMPPYFQVALRVKSMDDVPVDVSYAFHRELNAAGKPAAGKK